MMSNKVILKEHTSLSKACKMLNLKFHIKSVLVFLTIIFRFFFLFCLDCSCKVEGSTDTECDATTGQCHCKCAIEGLKCDRCMDYHFDFPNCESNCKELRLL